MNFNVDEIFGEKVVKCLMDIEEYVDIVNVFCCLEFLFEIVEVFD